MKAAPSVLTKACAKVEKRFRFSNLHAHFFIFFCRKVCFARGFTLGDPFRRYCRAVSYKSRRSQAAAYDLRIARALH